MGNAVDAAAAPAALRARELSLNRASGGRAWHCLADDGSRHVVKTLGGRHDVPGPASKVLPTELICGRLGRLFDPALCPPVAVVDIPRSVAARAATRSGFHVPAGPAFASAEVAGAQEVKDAYTRMPLRQAARLVVFQTWLGARDPALLHCPAEGTWLSIDHEWYLTGRTWDYAALRRPLRCVIHPAQVGVGAHFAAPRIFDDALNELASLDEYAVRGCFETLPEEWGLAEADRKDLAEQVLMRRSAVASAVSILWAHPVLARRRPWWRRLTGAT